MKNYKVLRAMIGDRFYGEGEIRQMSEFDARHLVAKGLLQPMEEQKTADQPAPSEPVEAVKETLTPAPKKKGR